MSLGYEKILSNAASQKLHCAKHTKTVNCRHPYCFENKWIFKSENFCTITTALLMMMMNHI